MSVLVPALFDSVSIKTSCSNIWRGSCNIAVSFKQSAAAPFSLRFFLSCLLHCFLSHWRLHQRDNVSRCWVNGCAVLRLRQIRQGFLGSGKGAPNVNCKRVELLILGLHWSLTGNRWKCRGKYLLLVVCWVAIFSLVLCRLLPGSVVILSRLIKHVTVKSNLAWAFYHTKYTTVSQTLENIAYSSSVGMFCPLKICCGSVGIFCLDLLSFVQEHKRKRHWEITGFKALCPLDMQTYVAAGGVAIVQGIKYQWDTSDCSCYLH